MSDAKKLGIVKTSVDTLTEMLSEAITFPPETKVLAMDYEGQQVKLLLQNPLFRTLEEGEETPLYNMSNRRDENGKYRMTLKEDNYKSLLPRKKANFSDRFELEQAILGLWGMFDYIHLIIGVLDNDEKSDDDVVNMAFGVCDLMRAQYGLVYSYEYTDFLSLRLQEDVLKLIDELFTEVVEYYDGENPVSREELVQKLLQLFNAADAAVGAVFSEFEDSIHASHAARSMSNDMPEEGC